MYKWIGHKLNANSDIGNFTQAININMAKKECFR